MIREVHVAPGWQFVLSERFAWILGGRGGFGGGSSAFGSGSDGQSRGRFESDMKCRNASAVSFPY